jgi:hypothetical protein
VQNEMCRLSGRHHTYSRSRPCRVNLNWCCGALAEPPSKPGVSTSKYMIPVVLFRWRRLSKLPSALEKPPIRAIELPGSADSLLIAQTNMWTAPLRTLACDSPHIVGLDRRDTICRVGNRPSRLRQASDDWAGGQLGCPLARVDSVQVRTVAVRARLGGNLGRRALPVGRGIRDVAI